MKRTTYHLIRWLYLFKSTYFSNSLFRQDFKVYGSGANSLLEVIKLRTFGHVQMICLILLGLSSTLNLNAQVAPNCNGSTLAPSIDIDDSVRINIGTLVLNIEDAQPVDLSITNAFGQILFSGTDLDSSAVITLSACNLTSRTLTYQPSNGSTGMSCMGTIQIPSANSFAINVSDTAFWCISAQIGVAADDVLCDLSYYNEDAAPYTTNPTIAGICDDDIYLESLFDYNMDGVADVRDARDYYCDAYERVGLRIVGDWITNRNCGDSDTAQVIHRQYALNYKSTQVVANQSIVVYRLPQLAADNFIAPSSDTLYCALQETTCASTTTSYPWAQVVGLHREATDPTVTLFYPQSQIDIASAQGSATVLIRRSDGTELTAAEIDDNSVVSYNGIMSYAVEVERGDQVYVLNTSGNLAYETVGDTWFLQVGASPTWITLVIISVETSTQVCDIWDNDRTCFDGVRLIIPESPLDPSGDCDTLCLSSSQCGTNYASTTTSVGSGCSGYQRVETVITQDDCYSGITSTCVSNSTSGVVVTGTGSSTVITITQEIYKIDTLAPIFEFASACSNVPADSVVSYEVDNHSCMAEVFVPCVNLKDSCSGVQEVKVCIVDAATGAIQSDGIIRNLSNGSGNSWCHTANPFTLPSGTYNVRYKWSDSCSNMDSVDWFRLEVIDVTRPAITMTNGTLFGVACDDTIWYEPSGLIANIQENCFVCDTLYRRADWATAFGVDLCLPSMSGVTTQAALESYLDSLDAVFAGNDIEAYYLEQYNWIVNDRHCTDVVQQKLIESWRQGLLTYWNNNCLSTPISLATTNSFGAGWTQSVPVSTIDACGNSVEIEVLVIDNSSNCGTSSDILEVEIDPNDTCACVPTGSFSDITLTCGAYLGLGYESALTAARSNNTTALDALLGVPRRVDLSATRTAADSIAYDNRDAMDIDTSAAIDIDWVVTSQTAQLGLYEADCDLTFTQTVDTVYDATQVCPNTPFTIVRTFVNTAANSCGIAAGSVSFTQSIHVSVETAIAYINKNDFDTSCFNLSSALIERLIANPDSLITSGSEVSQIDDISITATIDNAAGGCRNYFLSFRDEFADEYLINTSVSPNDTFGLKYIRIYTIVDLCKSVNSGFQFTPDTTFLTVTLDTMVTSTACMDFNGSSISRNALISGNTMNALVSSSIADVSIMAEQDGQMISSAVSDDFGHFELSLPEGETVKIRASKDINAAEGINVNDILTVQLHVQGLRTIEGSYRELAADVNADGIINSKDILEMRAVVLGKQSSFSNNESWYLFDQLTGEKTTHLDYVNDNSNLNFMGVKIGDVDTDNDPIGRSADNVTFEGQTNHMFSGDQTLIEFTANEDLMGYQMALRYDPAKLTINDIKGIGEDSWFKVEEGYIRMNYHGSNAESFKLLIKAHQGIKLSEVLRIEKVDYAALAVNRDYESLPVELGFKEDNLADEFALFWSYPNPAKESAFIPFKLANDSDVELRFFDAAGKLLKVHQGHYQAGTNKYEVFTSELGASGVVYYMMNTGDFVATKRMIILN